MYAIFFRWHFKISHISWKHPQGDTSSQFREQPPEQRVRLLSGDATPVLGDATPVLGETRLIWLGRATEMGKDQYLF